MMQVATAKGLRMANEDSYIIWEATSCLAVLNWKKREPGEYNKN